MKPTLDPKTAMRIAKQSFADSSHQDTTNGQGSLPAPSAYITMTAANLIKFFQLASKDYQP